MADSGIFKILSQLDIFMYIMVYSEPMAYSNIFVDIFSQFLIQYKNDWLAAAGPELW